MSIFVGTVFNDFFFGPEAVQYGLDGNDRLSASADNKQYFLYGGQGNDDLDAFNFDDFLYGGGGNDTLVGLKGRDTLVGDAGRDALYGDFGNDVLIGGPGKDFFVFDSSLNSRNNVDTVEDFHNTDLIYLDKAVFANAGNANTTLTASRFGIGSSATTSSDRIIYNPDDGALYYTPNGSQSSTKLKFAVLDRDLNVSHDDFFIFN